jgi:hypothetical protein
MARRRTVAFVTCVLLACTLLSSCLYLLNEPPTASFTATPTAGDCPLTVSFSGISSSDDEGIVSYGWDFGDGWGASGATAQHTYTHPGTYGARLTVEDAYGEWDTASHSVVVYGAETYNRQFDWTSHGEAWTWEIAVPQSLHAHYAAILQRPICYHLGPCDWYKYVLDPDDDAYIGTLADNLYEAIADHYDDALSGYHGFLQFALDFVTAAIPYTVDSLPDEWPRYPLETLVDVAGDCEDTGILYCSIVRSYAASTHLIFFPKHLASAVPVSWEFINSRDYSVGYYEYDGAYYVICETTGDPPKYWRVGELPTELRIPWTTGGFWFYDVGLHAGLQAKGLVHDPTS